MISNHNQLCNLFIEIDFVRMCMVMVSTTEGIKNNSHKNNLLNHFQFLYITLIIIKMNEGGGLSNTACHECLPKKRKMTQY